jgi:hypothetical protein
VSSMGSVTAHRETALVSLHDRVAITFFWKEFRFAFVDP